MSRLQTPSNQAGKIRSLWIIIMSIIYTGSICIQSIIRGIKKTNSRTWVNTIMQTWIRKMFRLLRIECTVYNPYNVAPQPNEATIIIANHSSLFDIPIGLSAFPNESIRMLAKKEMNRIPLMKYGLRTAEFPIINRQKRTQAIKDLQVVRELLKSGIIIWIFAEGTRSKDGKVGPFKKGGFITAIETKATIIPLGIRGAFSILPARTFQFNLNQHAEVHIGQPIYAGEYTLENKEALIEKVRNSILELTGETASSEQAEEQRE